jgi:hypothetical protein
MVDLNVKARSEKSKTIYTLMYHTARKTSISVPYLLLLISVTDLADMVKFEHPSAVRDLNVCTLMYPLRTEQNMSMSYLLLSLTWIYYLARTSQLRGRCIVSVQRHYY